MKVKDINAGYYNSEWNSFKKKHYLTILLEFNLQSKVRHWIFSSSSTIYTLVSAFKQRSKKFKKPKFCYKDRKQNPYFKLMESPSYLIKTFTTAL